MKIQAQAKLKSIMMTLRRRCDSWLLSRGFLQGVYKRAHVKGSDEYYSGGSY